MTEKFTIEKTSVINGFQKFTLSFLGVENGLYKSNFNFLYRAGTKDYEYSSDIFESDSLYNAMLRAYSEGRKILAHNRYDTTLAKKAFSIFQEQSQLKFRF